MFIILIMTRYFIRLLPILFLLFAYDFSLAASKDSKTKMDSSVKLSLHDKEGKKDSVVLWKNTTIQPSEVFDRIVIMWGNVEFYGTAKELVIIGGTVDLHDGAKVTKKLVVLGGKFNKRDGAQLKQSRIKIVIQ